MHVTREGPDLHGLVTVLSTHSVLAKPLTHGQPGGWEWRSSKEYVRIVGGVDTHKDLHVAAIVDEQGSDHWNAILRHDSGRAIAKCWPGCAPSECCNASESCSRVDRCSYGAGLSALHATSKGHGPRGHDSGQAGSASAWQERRSRRAERRPCRLCRPADRDVPRSRDGMIVESLRVLKACRKTAVSARRIALQ